MPEGYGALPADLKQRMRAAQVRADLAVNRELVLLYWQIGREILARQAQEGWGAKVITPLLARYQQELPQELRAVLPSVAQLEMALNEITEVGGGANDE
ncbi:DUF1016 family protein [Arthrospira platensis FACHB-971]|nr:DUF1016 family protein [Arthrospira platensis FACHB-971]MBD2671985.1 DUF1016 family protein [Arthrospira platensis FACHB-439]MBD2713065.1 DUF1016 family protein [Arthrospira platensis FACHB-835]